MRIRSSARRPLLALALALVLLLSFAGIAQARQRVRATDNQFRPARVSVSVGEKVIWRNTGSNPHTVTAYGGNWTKDARLFQSGDRTSRRFAATGVYKYFCEIHGNVVGGQCSGMCGKVTVS
jgi:plastocyanin